MRTALSSVLLDLPRAAAIWLSLLGLVTFAVAGLLLRPRLLRFDAGTRIREAALPGRPAHSDEQRDQDRWAEEVTVAAGRAEATARRRRDEWLAAQDEAERAWQAYEVAEAGVRRLSGAAGLPCRRPRAPPPSTPTASVGCTEPPWTRTGGGNCRWNSSATSSRTGVGIPGCTRSSRN
ncbi:hypothetical protein [Micromonospora tarapacensis]|uniref:hypothetical protein n=1 Tax=Micromonospora tarapacensis TaxID=2835305 RepID=UPI001E2F1433|nr:hypothetical protein [Micromonospora tarapacensis]